MRRSARLESRLNNNKIKFIRQLALPLDEARYPDIANKFTMMEIMDLAAARVHPIVYAVYLGEYDLVKRYLNEGISVHFLCIGVDAGIFRGRSLLDITIERDYEDIFDLLFDKGVAKFNGPSIRIPQTILKKRPNMAAKLVQHGYLDHCAREDILCYSPLHHAAEKGDIDTLDFWLNAGASPDVNTGDDWGTPLRCAIHGKQEKAVAFLLNKKANPNLKPYIALAIIYNNSIGTIKLLISHGASIHKKIHDTLPIELAINRNREDVIGLMANDKTSSGEHLQYVLALMANEYNITDEDFKKRNTYLLTVVQSWVGTLSKDRGNSFYEGIPLLHHIMISCDESTALMALQNGADFLAETETGITALHLAILCNYQRLASALIRAGVNISSKDYTGSTPLNHALNYIRTLPIAQKLIEQNALKDSDLFYVYDSYKQLNIKSMAPLINQLLIPTHLREQWKEFYLTKICSHIFGVMGVRGLERAGASVRKIQFLREGLIAPMKFLYKIGKRTRDMENAWPQLLKDMVFDLCMFASRNSELSDSDYLERIKTGKPTLIITGKWIHAWYVLLYQSYYIICDSNLKEIAFCRYDKESLTEDIIGQLRYHCAYPDSRHVVDYTVESIKETLKVKLDSKSFEYSKHIMLDDESSNNCTWKSFELAVNALLIIEYILHQDVHGLSGIFGTFNGVSQAQLMRIWVLDLQLYFAQCYLIRHENEQGYYKPDFYLLNKMKELVNNKMNDVEHPYQQAIKLLINNFSKMAVNDKTYEPPYRGGSDYCFSHFLYVRLSNNEITYQKLLEQRNNINYETKKIKSGY